MARARGEWTVVQSPPEPGNGERSTKAIFVGNRFRTGERWRIWQSDRESEKMHPPGCVRGFAFRGYPHEEIEG